MRKSVRLLIVGGSFFLAWHSMAEQTPAIQWPLRYTSDVGVATVYQPQIETFKDDPLTVSAAVSVQLKGEKSPWFGAVWLEGRVSTYREAGLVTVTSVEVKDVKAQKPPPTVSRS